MKPSLKIIVAAICVLCLRVGAQDIHFSQYLQTPLLLNPAAAGTFNGEHRLNLNYRNQWGAFGMPYKTVALAYDTKISIGKTSQSGYIGLGGSFFNDKAGDPGITQFQFNAAVSGGIKLDESNTLAGGIQGGFVQRSIDLGDQRWGNQYDGKSYNSSAPSFENIPVNSYSFADMSAGVLWQYHKQGHSFTSGNSFSRVEAGFSLQHVNKPIQEYSTYHERLNMRYVALFSADLDLGESRITLIPSGNFSIQGTAQEIVTGMSVKYKIDPLDNTYTDIGNKAAVLLGVQVRLGDAIIPMAMFQMKEFALGISYDINYSSLRSVSNRKGGYELSFRYLLARGKYHH